MLLGFKRRFAPYVENGSKKHSIREDVNDRWKADLPVDAYVDPRQRTMRRLIPRTVCTKTESIVFDGDGTEFGTSVMIDGTYLDQDERNLLAWKDGFRHPNDDKELHDHCVNALGCFGLMMNYWSAEMRKGKRSLPWRGKLIHWA